MATDYLTNNPEEGANVFKRPDLDPASLTQQSAAQQLIKTPGAKTQFVEQGTEVLANDSISKSELPPNVTVNYYTKDGKVYADITVSKLDSPELAPPDGSVSDDGDLPPLNTYFNAVALNVIFDAMNAMMRAQADMKRSDKMTELKWAEMSLQMSKDSAKLTIELGKLEQMEHIYKALVQVAVGIASAGAAAALPRATSVGGAAFIAISEAAKGVANAFGELVGAVFAVPKATVQADKQLKDAVNQLLLSNKEHAASAAKDEQDELNRILQQLSDAIQKFKEALKLIQG